MAFLDFLDKERCIARADYNRWLVPPAALAIHLCIGMAYGFSVFWLPLSKAIGIKDAFTCPADMSFLAELFSTTCDWKISMLGWIFTLFYVLLGTSAALLGGWMEHAGPRKAGVVAALCWAGGLVISALGIYLHQILLLWLGSGVIGGIGLGLGYISPVTTLIKWFPDRRGMATGMAIMAFGGGAMIGAPLANELMNYYATPVSVGVWETFLVMAAIYFVFMVAGAMGYRVPPDGWQPDGWSESNQKSSNHMITDKHVHVSKVWGIPQFWLIWAVLCLNVTAGIGVIGMASPLLQEMFAGKLIGISAAYNELTGEQKMQIAAIAAGFTGLLSLFNIVGRFIWASISDYIGRRATYFIFFGLGFILYISIPSLGQAGSVALFVMVFGIILSMYGGGFATAPAYLADIFGAQMVGAIHGRLLTAWATAGVLGPVLVNYIREYQIDHGVANAHAYDVTMYIMAGLLLLGMLCNAMVRPVAAKHCMSDKEVAQQNRLAQEGAAKRNANAEHVSYGSHPIKLVLAWSAVGVPLLIGIWITLHKAIALFM